MKRKAPLDRACCAHNNVTCGDVADCAALADDDVHSNDCAGISGQVISVDGTDSTGEVVSADGLGEVVCAGSVGEADCQVVDSSATLCIPSGWFFHEVNEQIMIVYQISFSSDTAVVMKSARINFFDKTVALFVKANKIDGLVPFIDISSVNQILTEFDSRPSCSGVFNNFEYDHLSTATVVGNNLISNG